MRADEPRAVALRLRDQPVLAGARERHMEDRAHRRAHGLQPERIAGRADQRHARQAGRVGGADDGAEIAGIAHAVERHPDALAPDRGFRREALPEDADDVLRVLAPRDLLQHLRRDFEHRAARRLRLARRARRSPPRRRCAAA